MAWYTERTERILCHRNLNRCTLSLLPRPEVTQSSDCVLRKLKFALQETHHDQARPLRSLSFCCCVNRGCTTNADADSESSSSENANAATSSASGAAY